MNLVMKLKLTWFFLIAFFGLVSNAVNAQTGPEILLNEVTHDYGTVKYGANGNCEFVVTNTGNEPLIISSVKGSCSCMVPSWSKEPIAPGQSAIIKVKYDTQRPGPISKSLTVLSNAINEPTKLLRIIGKVLPREDAPINSANPENHN